MKGLYPILIQTTPSNVLGGISFFQGEDGAALLHANVCVHFAIAQVDANSLTEKTHFGPMTVRDGVQYKEYTKDFPTLVLKLR